MRARLFHTFLALSTGTLLLLSILLAGHIAGTDQRAMFLDRLQDTMRFAAAAEQVDSDLDEHALGADLLRYREGFGIDAAIVDRSGTVRASSGPIDLTAAPVLRALRLALTGSTARTRPPSGRVRTCRWRWPYRCCATRPWSAPHSPSPRPTGYAAP
jgi:hypothetical protein